MPLANTLFIGRLPPLRRRAHRRQSSTEARRSARRRSSTGSAAIRCSTSSSSATCAIVDSLIVRPPSGGKVLIDSTKGPLLAIAPRDSYEDAVLGFEIVGHDADGATTVNTNWPRRLQLPQLLPQRDAVPRRRRRRPADRQTTGPARRSRSTWPSAATTLTVVLPDKSTRDVEPPAVGKLAFHETDQLGVYDVMAGEQLVARFAVNLFDRAGERRPPARPPGRDAAACRRSSRCRSATSTSTAESPASPMRKELWTGLLLAALAVLVLEWYIYNRRVYV